MRTLLLIVITVAFVLATMRVCAYKGQPLVLGIVLTLLCGPFGLMIAALLPKTAEGRERAEREAAMAAEITESARTRPCSNCGRINSVTARVCPRCNTRLMDD